MYDFKRILVPLDFSECSQKALGVAIRLATTFDSELAVLHIEDRPARDTWEDNAATRAEMQVLENDESALRREVETAAAAVGPAASGLDLSSVKLIVRGGSGAADAIVATSEEIRSDLVVMGTHGRRAVADFFVGSTTERVLRRATCAVMAVKPDGYPFLRD